MFLLCVFYSMQLQVLSMSDVDAYEMQQMRDLSYSSVLHLNSEISLIASSDLESPLFSLKPT